MGIFDHLFGRDPRKDLARAEQLLDRGEADKALRLAERFTQSDDQRSRERAEELRQRAVDSLFAKADSSAEASAQEGLYEDAAEWLRSTHGLALSPAVRKQTEARIRELVDAARRAELREIRLQETGPESVDSTTEVDHQPVLDVDDAYDLLLGTIDDDLLELYEYQNADFRRAYVDLTEGRIDSAAPVFEQLATRYSKDAAIRLERGRCRLALGDREGARADFESVWETFGDEAIDRAGRISVPGLWADAMLGLGRSEELLERLDEVADPRHGDPELCQLYARALISTDRRQEARDFLTHSATAFPGEPVFNRLLALLYVDLGERDRAIAGLESVIAPACRGGCGSPQLDAETVGTLISIYLDEPSPAGVERSRELLEHLSHTRGGGLSLGDLNLLRKYHLASGNAAAAEEVAEKLAEFEKLGRELPREARAVPIGTTPKAAL